MCGRRAGAHTHLHNTPRRGAESAITPPPCANHSTTMLWKGTSHSCTAPSSALQAGTTRRYSHAACVAARQRCARVAAVQARTLRRAGVRGPCRQRRAPAPRTKENAAPRRARAPRAACHRRDAASMPGRAHRLNRAWNDDSLNAGTALPRTCHFCITECHFCITSVSQATSDVSVRTFAYVSAAQCMRASCRDVDH